MAGGSLASLNNNIDKEILKAAVGMKPVMSPNKNEYVLTDGKKSVVYNTVTKSFSIR